MTAKLTSMNTIIWNAAPKRATWSIGRNTTMNTTAPPVASTDMTGVPVRGLTCPNSVFARPSRAIANGYREAERIPELAVEASASIAAATMRTAPGVPIISSAAIAIIAPSPSLARPPSLTGVSPSTSAPTSTTSIAM